MKDDSGRVLVEGFYDDVIPLTARERATLAEVPDADAALRQSWGWRASTAAGVRLPC